MASSLSDQLLDRLERETKPGDDWPELVLAALDGDTAVDAFLTTAEGAKQKPSQAKQQDRAPKAAHAAYLHSITVEGFRGIGRPAILDLGPGPGLTLVIGRNGSGKSSFAEALEQLFMGETFRWAKRTKEWCDGWRTLHRSATIHAEFALEEERASCVVFSQSADEADLKQADIWAQIDGKRRTGPNAFSWNDRRCHVAEAQRVALSE